MELVPEWAAKNPLFFIAGDDRRDLVTGNQPSYGTIVGSVTVDGVRCLRTATNGGTGNQLVWSGAGRTFTAGATLILLARRNGTGSSAYDMVCGSGSFNNGEDSCGFLTQPGSSVLYGSLKYGSNEQGFGSGRAMVTDKLELTIATFGAFSGSGTSAVTNGRIYQGSAVTGTRQMNSDFNRTFNLSSPRIGSRGGSAGGGVDVAAFGLMQYEFTDADIESWRADFWAKFRALSA